MNVLVVLLPILLIYMSGLYWAFNYFNGKAMWRGDNITYVKSIDKPMLNAIKLLLDFLIIFLSLISLLILPVTVVLSLSQGISSNWGVDISIFAGFSLDINSMSGVNVTGLRNPEITGKSLIAIDTANIKAFYLFMISQASLALAGLYGVIQIRYLVMSLKSGNAFCIDNAIRLKRIGYLVIAWNLISPVCQYFAWGSVINDINFSNHAVQLYPVFDFDVMAVFIGAMIIILSDLFLDATTISQEQQLTI